MRDGKLLCPQVIISMNRPMYFNIAVVMAIARQTVNQRIYREEGKYEEFIEYIKAEVIANNLDSLDEIKDAISKAEKEFNINLTEEQVNQIADVMKKISDLDIDPKVLLQQAGELYNKYGDTILSEAKDALNGIFTDEVKASLWDLIKQFFKTIFEAIANFFNK